MNESINVLVTGISFYPNFSPDSPLVLLLSEIFLKQFGISFSKILQVMIQLSPTMLIFSVAEHSGEGRNVYITGDFKSVIFIISMIDIMGYNY